MEDHENIYDKIKELLGSLPNQLSVLEEKIDIELQLEYFETSKRIKKDFEADSILKDSLVLFDPGSFAEDKKILLVKIAALEKVEAYRLIEKFLKEDPGDLKNWAILALQENRMLLESRLLGENHVFISTGLGGKGEKLRYFIVLFGKEVADLSDLQKKIIRNEFEISLKKYKGEIEEIKFSGSMSTILALIPMNAIIKQIFSEAISECNLYGNFLFQNFIISNVKVLSFVEIRKYIESQKNTSDRVSGNSEDFAI
jgi:hypothetical protein